MNNALSKSHRSAEQYDAQAGNAFFIILIAVVLFAALMFTYSRGGRQGGDSLSADKALLTATDVLGYAKKVERGVGRVMGNGFSEANLSFANTFVSGYTNASCTENECQVFNVDGGAISWKSPTTRANDGSEWVITGANRVDGFGATGTFNDSELLIILPNVNVTVCTALNNLLEVNSANANVPPVDDNAEDTDLTLFAGAFEAAPGMIEETGAGTSLEGQNSGCFQGDTLPASTGAYHFYHILMARP